jgi:hypothetical protein
MEEKRADESPSPTKTVPGTPPSKKKPVQDAAEPAATPTGRQR